MSGCSVLEHIDAVDAFARTLFLRADQHRYPSPSLSAVAVTVSQLHHTLRHLRVEAADPDSLLNRGDASSVHARQVQSLVRECGLVLKQLETVLDNHGASGGCRVDATENAVAAVRSRLVSQKASVDVFLDTVQVHNLPSQPPGHAIQGNEANLEGIKDKVDNIAARLFRRRDRSVMADDDEDRLWQDFASELEKEGFSPQVLRQHKDVLRAYIRELESVSTLNGGAPPTVRGLLENQGKSRVPKQLVEDPSVDNEKCFTPVKGERRLSREAAVPPHQDDKYSVSPDDRASAMSDSTALISTKELMAMDSLDSGMAGLDLQNHAQILDASPRDTRKYLTFANAGNLPPATEAELSSSAITKLLGPSPGTVRPLPPHSGTSPQSAPQSAPYRLAPDRYGNEIQMAAQWTKIRRTLVSPEVLERAGVRYEARPEYVAVLGRLTREQIADYARQSADCRAARSGNYAPQRRYGKGQQDRTDSKSSRDEDDHVNAPWDNSDTTDDDDDKTSDKGTKSHPYIVNPPSKAKTSPASAAMPKPILKNKNENRVRFDPEPHEMDSKGPRSFKDERDRRGDYTTSRHRDHRDREGSSRSRDGHRRDSDRYMGERDRYGSDRHRPYDGDHHRPSHRNDRDRRGDRKGERATKKKAWGETLGAVGIGGAAAGLLGVLAEAAVGM